MVSSVGSRLSCAALSVLGACQLSSCRSYQVGGEAEGVAGAGAAGLVAGAGAIGAHAGGGGQVAAVAGSGGDLAGSGFGGTGEAGPSGEAGSDDAGAPSNVGGGGVSGSSGTAGSSTGGAGVSGGSGTGGTAGTGGTPNGPAPLGLVAFYEASVTQCPAAWTRFAAADGRLLAGVTSAAQVGVASGTALGNQEDRTHLHIYSVPLNVGSHGLMSSVGSNGSVAAGGTVQLVGATLPAKSGLPFTQLLACKLTQDVGQGDGFASATVAHFAAATCPDGWVGYGAADGRVLLPAPGASGVSAGVGASHKHQLNFTMNLLSVGIADSAGSAVPVASSGMVNTNGLSDPNNTGAELPTLAVLVCRKSAAPASTAVVPSGALAFLDGDACPSSWQRYTADEGRLLLGAATGIGASFGGAPLASGEIRLHQHDALGMVTLAAQSISSAPGSTGFYGTSGMHSYAAVALPAAVGVARVELRHCRKQ